MNRIKRNFNLMLEVSGKSLAWAFFGVLQMVSFFEIKHPAAAILALTGWCSIMWAIAREKDIS